MIRPSISMTVPQMLRCECTFDGERVHLTPTETRLLVTLLLNRGHILHATGLIERLWPDPDFEPDWAHRMIPMYVSRLGRKLPGLIQKEWGRGYLIERPLHDALLDRLAA